MFLPKRHIADRPLWTDWAWTLGILRNLERIPVKTVRCFVSPKKGCNWSSLYCSQIKVSRCLPPTSSCNNVFQLNMCRPRPSDKDMKVTVWCFSNTWRGIVHMAPLAIQQLKGLRNRICYFQLQAEQPKRLSHFNEDTRYIWKLITGEETCWGGMWQWTLKFHKVTRSMSSDVITFFVEENALGSDLK